MKVIILYMSYSWINTENVAKAMAEFLNATLPEVD
jgi:flavodoxin